MDTCSLRYVTMMSRCFFQPSNEIANSTDSCWCSHVQGWPSNTWTALQRSQSREAHRMKIRRNVQLWAPPNLGSQSWKLLLYQSNSWLAFRPRRFTLLSKFISSQPLDSQQRPHLCTSFSLQCSMVQPHGWSLDAVEHGDFSSIRNSVSNR